MELDTHTAALLQTGPLLERARAGDRGSRELLLETYRKRIEGFLHARIPASERGLLETQDVVQEVCLGSTASSTASTTAASARCGPTRGRSP